MSLEDYALNLILVAVVIRQARGKKLTAFGLLWPIGLVAWAAVEYLHAIPTAGNDLPLTLAGTLIGAVVGCSCGLLTRIHRLPDGSLVARATSIAALLWVVGVGSRLRFGLYVQNGGGPAIARFSAENHIANAAAWTACMILMSLTEVLGRTVLLATRGHQLRQTQRTLVPAP